MRSTFTPQFKYLIASLICLGVILFCIATTYALFGMDQRVSALEHAQNKVVTMPVATVTPEPTVSVKPTVKPTVTGVKNAVMQPVVRQATGSAK